MRCPDCVECRKDLDAAGVTYDYRDFAENLKNLKEFLKIRDENVLFAEIKQEGKIGIPCIVREDGSISFEWK
jgi:glutaredoxin-related protein